MKTSSGPSYLQLRPKRDAGWNDPRFLAESIDKLCFGVSFECRPVHGADGFDIAGLFRADSHTREP